MFMDFFRAGLCRAALIGAVTVVAGSGVAGSGGAFAADPAHNPTTPPTAKGAAADPVVARINGEAIHKSEVVEALAGMPQHVRQMPIQTVFPAMIDQVINGHLVAAAAQKQNLLQDPEVKEKIKRAEERAVQEAFLNRAVKERMSDDTVKKRYQQYLQENPAQDEVRARHILLASEAEGKAIIEQLKKGGDFAKIAKDKSTDTVSATQGGDLGFFTRDSMVQPFADAAFGMAAGKVSDAPVQTQFGWHVIKVEERRKAAPPTFDEMRGDLEGEISQEVVTTIIEELRAKAKIEQFSIDGTPASSEAPTPKP
ncbi:peptidyl-prolyl cis-trans isomerase C [Azospirillaceae bacterium]